MSSQLGLALKEAAIVNHRSKWAGTLASLDAHLHTLQLDSGFAVSADDAHAYLDTHQICMTGDRRWLGGLWKRDRWRLSHYGPSNRAACHHRVISFWKVV